MFVCVETVCKGYQQLALIQWERVKTLDLGLALYIFMSVLIHVIVYLYY